MPIDTRGLELAAELGVDVRSLRLDVGDLDAYQGVDNSNLVAIANELLASIGTGGSVDLEGLTDVDLTNPVTGDIIQRDGTGQFVNVTKDAYLGTNLTALDTPSTAYGRGLINLADGTALRSAVGTATDTVSGVVELSTSAEAISGLSASLVVTPAGLKAHVDAALTTLMGGVPPTTLDTILELAEAIQDSESDIAGLTTTIANKQNAHGNLTALSGLSLVANTIPYANGTGTLALTNLSANGRTLIGQTFADMRTSLDVYSKTEIGDPETDLLAAYIAARDA